MLLHSWPGWPMVEAQKARALQRRFAIWGDEKGAAVRAEQAYWKGKEKAGTEEEVTEWRQPGRIKAGVTFLSRPLLQPCSQLCTAALLSEPLHGWAMGLGVSMALSAHLWVFSSPSYPCSQGQRGQRVGCSFGWLRLLYFSLRQSRVVPVTTNLSPGDWTIDLQILRVNVISVLLCSSVWKQKDMLL